MSKRRPFRWGRGLSASILVVTTLATAPRAEAIEPVETVLAGTLDALDLVTYKVRTVLKKPDGSTVERTTPAVVGVPALVDVQGSLLPVPDVSVTVTPRSDRIRLSINKLATAPASLPVLVEAIFDLPGNDTRTDLGVAFGYDQQASTAPRGFTTDLLFSIFDPPRDSFTMTISPTGAPSSLSVIAELFARSGLSRVDPKRGRLTVDPVPEAMTFTADLESREARGARAKGHAPPQTERDKATVKVTTSRAVHAVIAATDQRGDFHRDLVADIRDLPTETTVSYTDETLERTKVRAHRRQLVEYTASSRIRQLDVDVDEFVGTVPQRSVQAKATNLPTWFTADLISDDVTPLGPSGPIHPVPVEARRMDYRAGQPIDTLRITADQFALGALSQQVDARLTGIPSSFTLLNERVGRDLPDTEKDERVLQLEFDAHGGAVATLEAGVGNDKPVAYLDNPAQLFELDELAAGVIPSYAFKHDDDLAVRLTGLSAALVDTADPLTVHASAAGGPFLIRECNPECPPPGTPPPEFRAVTAKVLDLPADATLTFSPTTQRTTFVGSAPIGELEAVVDANPPLFKNATHAELRAVDVPAGLELTIDGGRTTATDGSPVTLADFDAHGQQVGLLEVLFTSDLENVEQLPDESDGVLVRDLPGSAQEPDQFLLVGRITGLQSATVSRTDVLGTPGTTRIQSFTTALTLDAPLPHGDSQELRVDVGRFAQGRQERLVLDVDNRPDTVEDLILTREQVVQPRTIVPGGGQSPSGDPTISEVPFPRGQRLHYQADRSAGDLVLCRRAGITLPSFDCEVLADSIDQAPDQPGFAARVDPLPATVDLCFANDDGDFGRGHEGNSQNRQGEVEDDDIGEFPPSVAPVGCFALPTDVDQADLCDDEEILNLKLDCLDNPYDQPDLGRRLLVKTALEFSASETVTIDLFDCQKVATVEVTGQPQTACSEFMKVRDLKVRTLRAQLDSPVDTGDSGYVFLDTQRNPVSGDVLIHPDFDAAGETLVQLNLPERDDADREFWADERLVVFEAQITGLDGSIDVFNAGTQGECEGPFGTDAEVQTVLKSGSVTPRFELFDELC